MDALPLYVGTGQPDYVRYAVAELRALDPELSGVELLGEGLFRFVTARPRAEWAALLAERPPVFLRHQHPVDGTVPLTGDVTDLDRLAAATRVLAAGAGPEVAGCRVAVQVRRLRTLCPHSRYAVAEAVARALAVAGAVPSGPAPAPAGTEADAAPAGLVLSVTLVGATGYLGLSTPVENLSAWAGGEVRYRREGLISRAAFKLLEALDTLDIPVPAGGRALDLGAAPGGWTQVLLDRGLHVTAVDPAPLSPALAGHPRLEFRQADARAVAFPPGRFDLLTCDMNGDPLATARLVGRLAPALRPGGTGVLTVKLLTSGPPGRLLRRVEGILAGAGLTVVRLRQLFHNRDEVTAVLRRREG